MDIKEMIPEGYEHAATRKNLRDWYGAEDRSLRVAIERENSRGEVAILNVGDGSGYFKYSGAGDDPYYFQYTDQIRSRIRSLERKLRAIKKARKKIRDKDDTTKQMTLEEFGLE